MQPDEPHAAPSADAFTHEETSAHTAPPPLPVPQTQPPPRLERTSRVLGVPRYHVLRSLLFLNAVAAGALAFAFVGSSSQLSVVTQTVWKPPRVVNLASFCLEGRVAFQSDDYGDISTGGGPCPPNAKPTAVVTTEIPWLFTPGLALIALTALGQMALVRRGD